MRTQGHTYHTNAYPQEGLFFSTPSHEEEKNEDEYLIGVQRQVFQDLELYFGNKFGRFLNKNIEV